MHSDAISDLLTTCKEAACAGGRELLAWRGRFHTRQKGIGDLVTDADIASQETIRRLILSRYPDHLFLGEEEGATNFGGDSDRPMWVVDPLDGTTNYVHGYQNFAVSVAVVCGSEVQAGVIYDPVRKESFSAALGQGAWCNGEKLRVSEVTNVGDALVGVSLPAHVRRDSADLLDFIEAAQAAQAVRRSGSAALNLAHVANGSLDAFWATHIHPWDVAAGVLLICEAGGVVTGRNGKPFDLWKPHFLAASGRQLHKQMLEVLTEFTPK